MSRDVLLFGDASIYKELIGQLTQANWQPHLAAEPTIAKQILSKNSNIYIGLIHFANAHAIGDEIERLIAMMPKASHIEWIALLPSELANDVNLFSHFMGHIYDYHTLPIDIERLLFTLGHAHGMASMLARSYAAMQQQLVDEMVGDNLFNKQLLQNIQKISQDDAPVLITGESGTGKEYTAQAIHQQSTRKDKPLVVVNCGALPETLIQSELFGHIKGSFTGAQTDKTGKLAAANNGTVFLDEIGELPLDMQVNLLRFLQEGTVQPVGSSKEIKLDVRVIAATNVNLEKAVDEGKFREDLYYRLNVLRLHLAPLRERNGDTLRFAQHYFELFSAGKARGPKGFSKNAIAAMQQHHWSGNIRELVNRIRRAVVMCDKQFISTEDLGLEHSSSLNEMINTANMTLEQARDNAESELIQSVLEQTNNNISKAAEQLQVSRVTLYRLLKKHPHLMPNDTRVQ